MSVDHPHRTQRSTNSPLSSVLALLTAMTLALTACATQTGPKLGHPAARRAIPPMDLAAPQQTETATFALG